MLKLTGKKYDVVVFGSVVRESLSLHPTEELLTARFQRRCFVAFKRANIGFVAESFVP